MLRLQNCRDHNVTLSRQSLGFCLERVLDTVQTSMINLKNGQLGNYPLTLTTLAKISRVAKKNSVVPNVPGFIKILYKIFLLFYYISGSLSRDFILMSDFSMPNLTRLLLK
jgi:hypothetical protein